MPVKGPQEVPLLESELALVKRIAKRDGITEDEAATQLVKAAIRRRARRNTGVGPAKVYEYAGKKPKRH